MIKNKDLIKLDLIIKDTNSNEILDTTKEDIAKQEKIYSSKITYEPLISTFGDGELLKGVEENIKDLKEGESKTFVLKKEQAFGNRDSSKIQLIPINTFKKQNINPKPGQHISFGNKTGKVLNVSGSRVQVDFNHDFSGRDLEYTVFVNKIYTDDKDKVNALFSKYFYFIPENNRTINFSKDLVEIILPQMMPKEVEYFKYTFVQKVLGVCNYENVKFSQIYSKNKEKNK